ncbi:hypothetical protein DPEC_G00013620 [Dallia pectoralis]|uniref:Uncharacterized protein n=1 Tax=Dallia pectoralis TaxID=75939 RepID=A0ACC2HLW8_DALPE|nr:hypothetical protein DPEC_G00013620 [Dallia pectoralis]
MAKKVTVAYALWALGGLLGLHHLYLGRDNHALLWMLTFGGFGLGWAREFLRIPAYVLEANQVIAGERRDRTTHQMARPPPVSAARFAGQISVGIYFGTVALIGLNSLSFFYLIVLPLSVGAGVHLVSSVGDQTTDLHKTLLACVITSPIFYGSTISPLPISIAASVTAAQHRRFKTNPRSGSQKKLGPRVFRLTLAWLAFSAPLCYCVFHNTTATLYYLSDCVAALLDMFWFFPWLRSVMEYFLLLPYRILCAFTGWGPSEDSWRKMLEILLTERSQREKEARAVLSVPEEASGEDIAQSYRELVKVWHPDHNLGSKMEESQKMFIQIQEAYETLLQRQKTRDLNPIEHLGVVLGQQSAGERMNADNCNGHPYMSGNAVESLMDAYLDVRVPNESTPNSQQASPNPSITVNSITIELHSDEDLDGAPQPERRKGEKESGWRENLIEKGRGGQLGVLGRPGSGFGERTSPQSVSSGPDRLPKGKLKCEVCGMICIGPNVLMVHKRSHTGERPFRCTECGASFTQKGNLLRHIKLHSGEKPFKCVICNYACRRRDALTGHIRTHSVSSPTVGKPFRCSYCGRSYKKHSSLEEHLEQCRSCPQDHQPALNTDQPAQVEDFPVMEPEPVLQSSTEKRCFIDRLANNITKRKRTTPQKFVGDNPIGLNQSDRPYELSPCPEVTQEGNLHGLSSPHLGFEAGTSVGMDLEAPFLRRCGVLSQPPLLVSPHPVGDAQLDDSPVSSSLHSHLTPLGALVNGIAAVSVEFAGQKSDEGHVDLSLGLSRSPTDWSNGCHDSKDKSDTESATEEKRSTGFTPPVSTVNNNQHNNKQHQQLLPHVQYLAPDLLCSHQHFYPNTCCSGDPGMGRKTRQRACPVPVLATRPPTVKGSRSPASGSPLVSRKAFVRVVDGEGRAVQSFRCEHCHMLFLDHVMFTIHMGCHGFHQPFQCNVCGYRNRDCYQFSSHIIRGEHQVGGAANCSTFFPFRPLLFDVYKSAGA